ncbi:TonB-dependent receptor domain-containing protein [Olivibacter domesticus]|uniref:Outer membrane receptor proteins, mostly Fe transport n=1 Tax=Olivibacter domesticus TaxID=407022 RepID=A0A1H7MXK8_OLID1|nr:TonB-dependent receptor [Olivibacter domesticus]SEL15769.1 Outer membrane receptor proteins, mostly Fe transport [Olivibacter domesticus]
MKSIILFGIYLAFAIKLYSQEKKVTLSGNVIDAVTQTGLAFANITLKTEEESRFVTGTITKEDGTFTLSDVASGNYILEISLIGYESKTQNEAVGQLSEFLDLGTVTLIPDTRQLEEVTVTDRQDAISMQMDRKVFKVTDNITQAGGSLLEAMRNLPGITMGDDGKVQLRGSDKVVVLIDGKQTALTGFGGQSGLDNIPASAVERIEVINNPSAKFDANGNAGIVNIIYKKEKQEGLNGKVGLSTGLGALWIKKENLPGIRPQYTNTPKINPSLSLNYRKKNINVFLQGDNLYTHTLNKNEFVDRVYDNGDMVRQQTKRNRNTNVVTGKGGLDWYINRNNTLTVSGLFSSEKIIDRGDEPFFNGDLSEQLRLWQFLEDELKTTVTVFTTWQHRFKQPGRLLNVGLNYTFHREDEKYFFTNTMPSFTGQDAFKLISDEHVTDFTLDYVQPLRSGRIEVGLKFRRRDIPTDMTFLPGLNSPLDSTAGGWADYRETIPALYGNYIFENRYFEIEAGLRMEYVRVQYNVNPYHPTYRSDGYDYMRPFPNLRLGYKFNQRNKLSVFYNRRVDRPNEVDIRIFPKYDDAEIIKVGNPGLRPQFTDSYELGYNRSWNSGSVYSAVYHKSMDATITRIASTVPGSNLIYNIFQNAGRSYNTGVELVFSQDAAKWATFNLNLNGYRNVINAFTVVNKYPVENVFTADRQDMLSGNVKLNTMFHLPRQFDLQFTAIYLAPDIVPQGKIYARFSIDGGLKKPIQQGKGEIFLNATDIANTLRIKREVKGAGFNYLSRDYYETQVVRVGYSYKF